MAVSRRIAAALVLVAVTGCGGGAVPTESVPPLPPITPAEVQALLAASDVPVVLNIWASWCAPCRSEAPLLREAAAGYADRVRFIGIDVRDDQDGARRFIAEYGLTALEHFFDPTGAVPAALGGGGVPLTWFFAPGGRLAAVHRGVIDERTLALQIDELLGGAG